MNQDWDSNKQPAISSVRSRGAMKTLSGSMLLQKFLLQFTIDILVAASVYLMKERKASRETCFKYLLMLLILHITWTGKTACASTSNK